MKRAALAVVMVALVHCSSGAGGSSKITGKVVVNGGSAASLAVSAIGPLPGAAQTGPDGSYEVDGVTNGSYVVSASVPGTVELTQTVFVKVSGSGAAPDLKFTALTTGPQHVGGLAGKIVYSDGSDSSNITVTLIGPTTAGQSAGTDGSYSFSGVSAGHYSLQFDAPDSLERRSAVAVSVTDQMGTSVPTITMTAVGTVTGLATYGSATTGNAGIEVAVSGDSVTAITADDGSYTLSPVRAGTQIVIATGHGITATAPVTVARGANSAPPISLASSTTPLPDLVQGTVGFENAQDPSIITVSALGTGFSTTADSTGHYALHLPDGQFDIVANAPHFPQTQIARVAVSDGSTAQLAGQVLTPWFDFPANGSQSTTLVVAPDGDHAIYATAAAGLNDRYALVDLRAGTMRDFYFGSEVDTLLPSRTGKYVLIGSAFLTETATGNTLFIFGAGSGTNAVAFTADEKLLFWGDGTALHRTDAATFEDNPVAGTVSVNLGNDKFLLQSATAAPYTLSLVDATTSALVLSNVSKYTTGLQGTTVAWSSCSGSVMTCTVSLIDETTGSVKTVAGSYPLAATAASALPTRRNTGWIELSGATGPLVRLADGSAAAKPAQIAGAFYIYALNFTGTSMLYETLSGSTFTLWLTALPPVSAATPIATGSRDFVIGAADAFADWVTDSRAIAFTGTERFDLQSAVVTPDTDFSPTGNLFVDSPFATWVRASDSKSMVVQGAGAPIALDTVPGGNVSPMLASADGKYAFIGSAAYVTSTGLQKLTYAIDTVTHVQQVFHGSVPLNIASEVTPSPDAVRVQNQLGTDEWLVVPSLQRVLQSNQYTQTALVKSSALGVNQIFATRPVGSPAVQYPSFMLVP